MGIATPLGRTKIKNRERRANMKTFTLVLAFVSAMTLAVPLWAQEVQECPEGERWDEVQKKCVPEEAGAVNELPAGPTGGTS